MTISDIAREAGVSKATVSRVLNNTALVEPSTRQRVQEVIDKYHYKPSLLARSLSTRRTSSIGVLVPEIDNPFFSGILRGVLEKMEQSGYTMVCFNSDEDPYKDIKALQDMIDYKYSGLLYTPVQDFSTLPERQKIMQLLKELDVPVVLMDRNFTELDEYNAVYFDDCNAIREAVIRLAKAGHTRIGLLNAETEHFLAKIRHEGYLKGLKESGLTYQETYDYVIPQYKREEAYRKSLQMLQSNDRPTAIITGNNTLTLGFLRALRECSMNIPEDIDIIGLDQIEALDLIDYGFSYIERDPFIMGEVAAGILLAHMEDPAQDTVKTALDYEIVIRT